MTGTIIALQLSLTCVMAFATLMIVTNYLMGGKLSNFVTTKFRFGVILFLVFVATFVFTKVVIFDGVAFFP